MLRGEREKKYWSYVTPEMMSDEERTGDRWICHPPSYRSEKFTQFLDKLDGRMLNDKHARFPRQLGSPRDKHIPPQARDWMIKQSSFESVPCESEELFSSESEDSSRDHDQ